jgi:hypothetical protein
VRTCLEQAASFGLHPGEVIGMHAIPPEIRRDILSARNQANLGYFSLTKVGSKLPVGL